MRTKGKTKEEVVVDEEGRGEQEEEGGDEEEEEESGKEEAEKSQEEQIREWNEMRSFLKETPGCEEKGRQMSTAQVSRCQ